MGCGESKHDVATGNTINRKKSDAGNGKSKDIETIKETSTNDDKTNSLVQPEENQNVSKNSGDDDNVGANAIADVKDKNGTKELKEEGTELEKTEVAVEEQEEGRLISKESPNHFFSSRKDEDIEGLAYEGRSEKSEYCSPRIESVKESLFNESDYEKEALVEETKQKNENGEPVIVTEENLATEAKTATNVEPKAPSPTVEEEQNAQQEKDLNTA